MDLNDLSPTERLALQRKNLKQRLGLGSQFMDGNAFFDYNVGGKLIALTVFTEPKIGRASGWPAQNFSVHRS